MIKTDPKDLLLSDLVSAKEGLKKSRAFKPVNEVQAIDNLSDIAHYSLRIEYLLDMLKDLKVEED